MTTSKEIFFIYFGKIFQNIGFEFDFLETNSN